ncbi:hypothetical protein BH11GEM1_BH11GEM1_22620 [soil metagenome]
MPQLLHGADRCLLLPGTHSIGGRGADALELSALEWSSAVATVTVPRPGMGIAVIQRTTAAIVVRLNDEPLGIAPASLHNGDTIAFDRVRLTYQTDNTGKSAVTAFDERGNEWEHRPSRSREIAAPLVSGIGARLLNVSTGAACALTDRRVVLGRDDACDLFVAGTGISRRHASVSPVSGGFLLRDESANGTKVNGVPVRGTYLLAHGDVIGMNDAEFRFEVEGMSDESIPKPDSNATQILDRSQIARILGGPPHGRRLSCTLAIVRGPHTGATFEMDKPVFAIGRARHNDVKLGDESVSSSHATLLRKGAVWYVVDLHSANGTFFDGSRVSGERELPSGGHLRIGAAEFVFRSFADGIEDAGTRRPKPRLWQQLAALVRGPNRAPDVA